MKHSFEVEIAKEYGVNCAILLDFIYYWVSVNKANDRNVHDGSYWTYNTVKAFEELFPYMTKKQIRSTLDKLEKEGLICSGNYNNSAYDRTKWYTVTEKGFSVFPKRQVELPYRANGSDSEGNPIPINIPINDNINTSVINNNLKEDKDINNIKIIINYLNEVCNKHYKYTTEDTKKYIRARLKDGFTVEDFKAVIDKKYKQWKNDARMEQYIRPSTLFGRNFESYLNQETVVTEKEFDREAWLKE